METNESGIGPLGSTPHGRALFAASVARPKGDLSAADLEWLQGVAARYVQAEVLYRTAVMRCVELSSFRAVSEATGISTNTLQRWKKEAGE